MLVVFSESLLSINQRNVDINETLLNSVRVLFHPIVSARDSPSRNDAAIPADIADIWIPFIKGSSFLGNHDINTGASVGNNPPTLIPKHILKINNVVKLGAHALKTGMDMPNKKIKTSTLILTLPTRRLNGIEDSALNSNIHPTRRPTVPLLTS